MLSNTIDSWQFWRWLLPHKRGEGAKKSLPPCQIRLIIFNLRFTHLKLFLPDRLMGSPSHEPWYWNGISTFRGILSVKRGWEGLWLSHALFVIRIGVSEDPVLSNFPMLMQPCQWGVFCILQFRRGRHGGLLQVWKNHHWTSSHLEEYVRQQWDPGTSKTGWGDGGEQDWGGKGGGCRRAFKMTALVASNSLLCKSPHPPFCLGFPPTTELAQIQEPL